MPTDGTTNDVTLRTPTAFVGEFRTLAIITSIEAPTATGAMTNDPFSARRHFDVYLKGFAGSAAVSGRFANRSLRRRHFTLDGRLHTRERNNGPITFTRGLKGFSHVCLEG